MHAYRAACPTLPTVECPQTALTISHFAIVVAPVRLFTHDATFGAALPDGSHLPVDLPHRWAAGTIGQFHACHGNCLHARRNVDGMRARHTHCLHTFVFIQTSALTLCDTAVCL